MTQPRDPHPPQPDSPEGEHRPSLPERLEHGVEAVGEAVGRVEHRVERAAEEVADEVAEHVPEGMRAPVRWTVKRLVLVISLAAALVVVVGIAASAYYVWNHTEWAAHEVTWRVNRLLTTRSDVSLSVGAVRGNPLSAVEVLEPRLHFRGEDGPPLLEARAMRLRYSTLALFTGRRGALVIELDRPVVRLARGPDGRLRLPVWKAETRARARGPGRVFDLALRIRDGDLLLPRREMSIEDFDLEADIATGAPTRVEVRSLAWKTGFHGLALERLQASVVVGDSVRVEVAELRGSDLTLRGRAQWMSGGSEKQVDARIERVRWSWLARVFDNATLDVPGEGDFEVVARGDRAWAGEVRARGLWAGLALDSRGGFGWHDGRLLLEPLSGRSDAGELVGGRLAWSKQGWEVEGTARRANPAHWGVVGIKEWPAGDLNGRFRYGVDTPGARGATASRLNARLSPSSWAGWSVDSGVVVVEMPASAPDSFRLLVRRRGGQLALSAQVDSTGWSGPYRITRFPLDEWPDGRASGLTGLLAEGEGRVDVRRGVMQVTGALEGHTTRWLGLETARWRLDEVRGRLLPTPDLEARARLEDVLYLGIHFDSVSTAIHLGDRSLTFPGLEAWAGDTLVTLSAGAEWGEETWRLVGTRASARSGQFDWVAEPPVEISGDAEGVTFHRLAAADGDARLSITGRWAVPGGSYDWRARAGGLRLDRLGLPPELGVGGVADVDLSVTGGSGDPHWVLRGRALGPEAQGHRADSLRLSLSGASSRLGVENLQLMLGGGSFAAQGQVWDTARPWPDTLTAAGVVRWLADAKQWTGGARADDLPLDRLARFSGSDAGWSGRLQGVLTLGGRPGKPEFSLTLETRPVSWRNVRMDEITARAEYREKRFRLAPLRMIRDLAVSEVSGELDVDLALGRVPQVLDAPMRWRVDLPNGDLALVPLLVPQIGAATGRFEIDGEVRGTPRKPQLFGQARIDDGKLRIAGREEVLEGVRAAFRFDGGRVALDSLQAELRTQQGDPGRVRGHGAIELRDGADPTYRFDVALRDFTALETGLYAARFDGDFHIVNGAGVRGHVLPHVTSDNVEIRRAVILYDFARQTEEQQVQASTQPLYWTYRIQIHANDNLRWQPPDGDIEFSADLSLDQSPDKLLIFGDMEALRGTYYFLSNRFTVNRATLTFDDVGGVDPLVDAEAITRLELSRPAEVTAGSIGNGEEKSTNITVAIQGRSSRPSVQFESEPAELDQAQILRELTVGRFVEGEQVRTVDSYLTRTISRQLSAELSRTFRGYLTDWEIASQTGGGLGQGDLLVGVGSQLTPRLRFGVRQRVPGTGRYTPSTSASTSTPTLVERDIEAEYRISRFFYFTSQLTQKRTVTGSTSAISGSPDFNVNLKARWEY